ncbi:MAG: DUF4136 domain-containing protein [Elusimicrobia bacterium]|nr:DUF4136 domain-containing protein [Elusimicrobiota bacterium]
MRPKHVPLIVFLFIAACASPRFVKKPGFDFSQIHSILLLEPDRADAGAVTDEIARELIRRGYSVKTARRENARASADAWLKVNVTQFIPDKKYLIQMNKDEEGKTRDVLLLNPVTEISGRTVYPSASVAGLEDAQIVVSNATVSLSVRLLDRSSKDILWSGAVTYEGLDLDAAIEGSVSSLLKHFPAR